MKHGYLAKVSLRFEQFTLAMLREAMSLTCLYAVGRRDVYNAQGNFANETELFNQFIDTNFVNAAVERT